MSSDQKLGQKHDSLINISTQSPANPPKKTALIAGITGQDGSYLSEFLISKNYIVHGIVRRASSFNTERLEPIYRDPHVDSRSLILHYGDMADGTGLRRILEAVQPDEIYNLAAQSHVRVSFDMPEYTADIVATGTLRLLEALRDYNKNTGRSVRYYQAGSSEMFGAAKPPQSEQTAFYPRSPYAAAKVAAHWYAVNYREAYNLFICNGILFNHESPRRGETFVTRKITRAVGRIHYGLQDKLYLGNLESRRDWGFAGDFVEAMWLMLQQDSPDDYVVATGESWTIRQFLELAFAEIGKNYQDYVEIDARYFRPTEVDFLEGDFSKARQKMGWQPRVKFAELVKMMVKSDTELARQEKILQDHRVA